MKRFSSSVGECAAAAHPRAERGVVVAAAPHLLDQAHHVRRTLRVMRVEPFAKQRRHLARQADEHPAGRLRAVGGCGLEDRFEIAVVELRNDRRNHDANRNARVGERLQRLQPPMRRGGARLHLPRELAVERRDRQIDARHPLGRHRRDDVDVALDQRRLGDDREGMLVLGEHLEHRARDFPFALDRLVRIGVRAERDRIAAVAGFCELRAQQRGRVGLRVEASSRSRCPVTGRDKRATAAHSNRCSHARSPDTG